MSLSLAEILDLVHKGVSVIETVMEEGQDAAPAIKIVKNFITGVKQGNLTDAEINAFEEQLDAMIEDFNSPLDK